MKIETLFDIGEIVFLITDEEQCERMVTNITIGPNTVTYHLSYGMAVSTHYEIEMSRTKDIHKQLNITTNESDTK